MCISVPPSAPSGTLLELRSCTEDANQRFNVKGTALVLEDTGLCVGFSGSATNRAYLTVFTCSAASDQQWALDEADLDGDGGFVNVRALHTTVCMFEASGFVGLTTCGNSTVWIPDETEEADGATSASPTVDRWPSSSASSTPARNPDGTTIEMTADYPEFTEDGTSSTGNDGAASSSSSMSPTDPGFPTPSRNFIAASTSGSFSTADGALGTAGQVAPGGILVGGIISGLAIAALAVLAAFLIRRHGRDKSHSTTSAMPPPPLSLGVVQQPPTNPPPPPAQGLHYTPSFSSSSSYSSMSSPSLASPPVVPMYQLPGTYPPTCPSTTSAPARTHSFPPPLTWAAGADSASVASTAAGPHHLLYVDPVAATAAPMPGPPAVRPTTLVERRPTEIEAASALFGSASGGLGGGGGGGEGDGAGKYGSAFANAAPAAWGTGESWGTKRGMWNPVAVESGGGGGDALEQPPAYGES
ncbi:hypothetical protein DFJ73DRAFT_963556 [Zopfochytrium polystomum]|nr:hypothetical protein DFJ73DRAFT_963556 [Zopfochytrium polystomum]